MLPSINTARWLVSKPGYLQDSSSSPRALFSYEVFDSDMFIMFSSDEQRVRLKDFVERQSEKAKAYLQQAVRRKAAVIFDSILTLIQ